MGYVILCRASIFPFSKEKNCDNIGRGEDRGHNVNISLKHKPKDDDLVAMFDYVFLLLAKQFKPDFVLESAVYDAGKM